MHAHTRTVTSSHRWPVAVLVATAWLGGCKPPDAGVEPGEVGGSAGTVSTGGRGGSVAAGRGGNSGSGSGGTAGAITGMGGAAGSPAGGRVVISEIMYHPVLEDDAVENHEFVELANLTAAPVSVAGWKLDGAVRFTLPAGTSIPARGFLVVARNRQRLLADVPSYNLMPAQVVGDFAGELDNNGSTIGLFDDKGLEVERVRYDDAFPWPLAADAFGASEQFFAPMDKRLPFMAHRFRGHSLERVNLELPSAEVANWAPSALDGATPGKVNGVAAATPGAIVQTLTVVPPSGEDKPILVNEMATVRAGFSRIGMATAPKLEWYAEFREARPTADKPAQLPMTAGAMGFQAAIPGQPNNSVVRYRVLGDDGLPLSPRPTDPNPWHLYAVVAPIAGKTPALHLFVTPADWAKLFDYVSPLRATGADLCKPNPNWDLRKPAVLVHEGKAYDVRARYQGSPYNRQNGVNFTKPFAGVGPAGGPNPLRALSWSIIFPRYQAFSGGRRHLHFNKLTQACPGGLTTNVLARLFTEAKVPSLKVFGYNRLHINGGYYHYVMDREHVDEQMLERVLPKGTPLGDLFKVVGYHRDQGPWGVGDARLLAAHCGVDAKTRWAQTYERQSHDWKGDSADVQKLIEGLHAARMADMGNTQYPALRKYFADNFDLDELLTHKAVFNWAKAWDDYWQNHFFYRRADGKWILIPYDYDGLMGGGTGDSFYVGEQNDRSARMCCDTVVNVRWWNYLIDGLLKAHRKEYNAKLHELAATVLAPANVAKIVDETLMTSIYDQSEARLAPGGTGCADDYAAVARNLKTFATGRTAYLLMTVPK